MLASRHSSACGSLVVMSVSFFCSGIGKMHSGLRKSSSSKSSNFSDKSEMLYCHSWQKNFQLSPWREGASCEEGAENHDEEPWHEGASHGAENHEEPWHEGASHVADNHEEPWHEGASGAKNHEDEGPENDHGQDCRASCMHGCSLTRSSVSFSTLSLSDSTKI